MTISVAVRGLPGQALPSPAPPSPHRGSGVESTVGVVRPGSWGEDSVGDMGISIPVRQGISALASYKTPFPLRLENYLQEPQ